MTTTQYNHKEIQTIKLLPEHLIDQIKAGEVVERPSSLIKELLENSIDANSEKIEIQIVDNGLELISVEDNGKGMTYKDLPYAFCRHATSKIERYEDLYKLHSYGFRGEALASISSSSKLICQSVPNDLTNGGRIEIDGGRQTSLSHVTGNKNGTSIFIRELFYNTPARLKFIKSKQSEKNSLKRIIHSFLIANPTITFSVKWDDSEKKIYKSLLVKDLNKRLSKIFFNNKKDHLPLHYFEIEYEGNRVWGYLSQEATKGNAGKSHFLFANNRLFEDKGLHQAILRNSKALWGEGNTGHYAIFINTPPAEIDVNVHPNKIQIKFFKASTINSLISSVISKSINEQIEAKNIQPGLPANNSSNNPYDHLTNNSHFSSSNDFPTFIERTNTETLNGSLLSNRYSVIELSGGNWIIDNYNLYQHYWNNINLNEASITPLIISEPFYLTDSLIPYLDEFENKGLEFCRINEELVLLKTIPETINGFSLTQFISPFILFKINQSSGTLLDFLVQKDLKCYQSIKEIQRIVTIYSLDSLKESNIICSFNESEIKTLFSH